MLTGLDHAIHKAGHHATDADHAIVRVPGSKWLIIGSWYESGGGDGLVGLDVLYDDDDPSHDFLTAADFASLENAAALARDYNAPFRKSFRLAIARMSVFDEHVVNVLRKHHQARRQRV